MLIEKVLVFYKRHYISKQGLCRAITILFDSIRLRQKAMDLIFSKYKTYKECNQEKIYSEYFFGSRNKVKERVELLEGLIEDLKTGKYNEYSSR